MQLYLQDRLPTIWKKDSYYVVTDGEGLTRGNIVTATSEKFYEEHPELVSTALPKKQVWNKMDADHAACSSSYCKTATGLKQAVEEMYEDAMSFNMQESRTVILRPWTEKFIWKIPARSKSCRCGIMVPGCEINIIC